MDIYEVTVEGIVDGLTVSDAEQIVDQLKDLSSYCAYDCFGCPRMRIDDSYGVDEIDDEGNEIINGNIVSGSITIYAAVLGSKMQARNFAWSVFDTFDAFGVKDVRRYILG